MQCTGWALGPVGTVFDPLAQHADLIIREADLGAGHHLRMCAATLHGADQQAAIRRTRKYVVATAGAAFEGGGFAGEIERGRRQAAIVALQAVLLQHRFDLGVEIACAFASAGWQQ